MRAPTPSLPERVFVALSADIRGGVLPPGTQLPIEPLLCERYGVSRTVLREAISRLKAEGLLDVRQGRGSFVRPLSAATSFRFDLDEQGEVNPVIELTELRLGVEATAAGLAARRRTPEQLEKLKLALDAMEAAVQADGNGNDADLSFHSTVAQATGNSQYRLFMEFLSGRIASAIAASRAHSARSAGLSRQAQREHRAIYDAIAAQDPRAAERAMRRHIEAAAERLTAQRQANDADLK